MESPCEKVLGRVGGKVAPVSYSNDIRDGSRGGSGVRSEVTTPIRKLSVFANQKPRSCIRGLTSHLTSMITTFSLLFHF